VDGADLLAGYSQFGVVGLNPVNGHARVGSVWVGGDWVASNLYAVVDIGTGQRIGGARAGPDSRIDSLWVGGAIRGTAAAGDEFRITAHEVRAVAAGRPPVGPLQPGPGNDHLAVGATGDVLIEEVG
jgi:hypothetical protein